MLTLVAGIHDAVVSKVLYSSFSCLFMHYYSYEGCGCDVESKTYKEIDNTVVLLKSKRASLGRLRSQQRFICIVAMYNEASHQECKPLQESLGNILMIDDTLNQEYLSSVYSGSLFPNRQDL